MLFTRSSSLLPFSSGTGDKTFSTGTYRRQPTRKLTAVHDLPVVQYGLRERLATSLRTKLAVEAERLHDGQVGLDGEERSTGALLLIEDVTSPAGQDTVDTTHGGLVDLDLDQEDGLLETGLGEQAGGVADTTADGDDLSSTTVNGIGVELHEQADEDMCSIRWRRHLQ